MQAKSVIYSEEDNTFYFRRDMCELFTPLDDREMTSFLRRVISAENTFRRALRYDEVLSVMKDLGIIE